MNLNSSEHKLKKKEEMKQIEVLIAMSCSIGEIFIDTMSKDEEIKEDACEEKSDFNLGFSFHYSKQERKVEAKNDEINSKGCLISKQKILKGHVFKRNLYTYLNSRVGSILL